MVVLQYTTTVTIFIRDDENDDEKRESFFNIAQNRVCCSLGYMYTYIGTENFGIKVLWVYKSSEV